MSIYTFNGKKFVNETGNKNYDLEIIRGEKFIVEGKVVRLVSSKRIKFEFTAKELKDLLAQSVKDGVEQKRTTKATTEKSVKAPRAAKPNYSFNLSKNQIKVDGTFKAFCGALAAACSIKDLYRKNTVEDGIPLILVYRKFDDLHIGTYSKINKSGWYYNDLMTKANPNAGTTRPKEATIDFKNSFSIVDTMKKHYGDFSIRNAKAARGIFSGPMYKNNKQVATFRSDFCNTTITWSDAAAQKAFTKLSGKDGEEMLLRDMCMSLETVRRMKQTMNKGYLVFLTKKNTETADVLPTSFGYVRGNDKGAVEWLKNKYGKTLSAILNNELKLV